MFIKDVWLWEIVWSYQTFYVRKLRQNFIPATLVLSRWKAVARSYVWWPKLDEAIEEICKVCSGCRSVQNIPSAAPVHPWNFPPKAWHRLHIDFAGPFQSAMFLIVVDAHSKWPEIFEMKSTTSNATINTLRTLFVRQGIPVEVVSDNWPQFRSEEFRQFMESNAIRHITSSPFHPRTNGQAERFVQSFKKAIKSALWDSACINKKINSFLCKYRITPQGTKMNHLPCWCMAEIFVPV